MNFPVILADPPWRYETYSERGTGKSAAKHYATEGAEYIASLPVPEVAAKDCTLLLWATNPLLPDAFSVLQAWGFTYKSLITWVKMSRLGAVRMGTGYQVRGCTEQILIATRGKPAAPPPGDRPLGVVFHPAGEHSRKPDFQYELAENYPGPYLEMFCRPRAAGLFEPGRPGWVHTGLECDGLDMREALARLAAR